MFHPVGENIAHRGPLRLYTGQGIEHNCDFRAREAVFMLSPACSRPENLAQSFARTRARGVRANIINANIIHANIINKVHDPG